MSDEIYEEKTLADIFLKDPKEEVTTNVLDAYKADPMPKHQCTYISTAVLELLNNADSQAWIKGAHALGFKLDQASIQEYTTDPNINLLNMTDLVNRKDESNILNSIRDFFDKSPEWIFFSGHFNQNLLWSDEDLEKGKHKVEVRFERNGVKIWYWDQEADVSKNGSFAMHKNCKVTIWTGCRVCGESKHIETLRLLFGKPLILGFAGSTNVNKNISVIGTVEKEGTFLNLIQGNLFNYEKIRDAWLEAGLRNLQGKDKELPCAIDPDGRRWRIKNGKKVEVRKYSD